MKQGRATDDGKPDRKPDAPSLWALAAHNGTSNNCLIGLGIALACGGIFLVGARFFPAASSALRVLCSLDYVWSYVGLSLTLAGATFYILGRHERRAERKSSAYWEDVQTLIAMVEAGLEPSPRNFTNGAWQKARTDGELKYTIFQGAVGTAMIANEAMFDDPDDVWHVVNYLRSLSK